MHDLMEMLRTNRLNKNTINTKRINTYRHFTLQDTEQRFGLKLKSVEKIVENAIPYPPSEFLKQL